MNEEENNTEKFPNIVGQPAEIFYNGKWVQGRIHQGYRFRDGIVTIITDDGKKLSCGSSRTDLYRPIIKQEENNMENYIAKMTDELVEKYKKACLEKGLPMNAKEEVIFRAGIQHGFLISGMALVNAPYDRIFSKENKNETKIS